MLDENAVHGEQCRPDRGFCADDCGHVALSDYLSQPTAWPFDQRLEQERKDGIARLLRGEVVPA